jgi:hypothetical protein
MARRTAVPVLVATEIVDTISHWHSLIGAAMTSEAGRRVIQEDLGARLRAGTIETAVVIAMAEAGHQGADLALRAYAATYIDAGREPELSAQVRGYVVKSLLRPIVTYPRGHNIADTWTRDIGIGVMVDVAAARWSLPATRGRHTEEPSAAYFVSLVLRRQGIKLKEARVNRIYWRHGNLAARLAASVISLLKNS